MYFYQFNIGDYRKDTSHLSIIEHGVYRLLLDTYYLTESPLTSDQKQLARLHSLRSAEEKAALDVILSDFFELTGDGYRHHGCEKVMAKVYEKSEKARISAMKKWGSKKTKSCERIENECERIENECERIKKPCEQHATNMLPITHYPLPITQDTLPKVEDAHSGEVSGEMILKSGDKYPVYESQVEEWAEAYPAIDIIQQLKSMKAWLEANPQKRKTKTGMPRFINSWLNRAANNG